MRKALLMCAVAALTLTCVEVATPESPVTTQRFDLDGGNSDVIVKVQDGCAVEASTIYGYTLPAKGCVTPHEMAVEVWEYQAQRTK